MFCSWLHSLKVWSLLKIRGDSDGDTITILTSNKEQIKIRLAEIDAPESNQPYGKRSKQLLSELVFNRNVSVEKETIDRYKRVVGRVYLDDFYVNAAMIEAGAAWVYRKYATDSTLFILEEKARKNKIGLWALPEAQQIPPWEWRKKNRGTKATDEKGSYFRQVGSDMSNSNFSCGSKRTCSQMLTCKEANYYLKHCELSRLDRDGDGIPCESICR